MNQEKAQQLIGAAETAQVRLKFTCANSACGAAGVSFADYKEARFLVYGLNTAV